MRRWKCYKLSIAALILLVFTIWGNQVYLLALSSKNDKTPHERQLPPPSPQWIKGHPRIRQDVTQIMSSTLRNEQLMVNEKHTTGVNMPQLKVILMASYRSGSSFTGELLRQNPNMLYLYEPFKVFVSENHTAGMANLSANIRTYIPRLFNCAYADFWLAARTLFPNDAKERVLWYNKLFKQLAARHSKAFGIKDMERVCHSYSLRSMKTIRNQMLENIFPLLNTSSQDGGGGGNTSSTKILNLVRDPRGIAVSRHLIDAWQRKHVSLMVYLQDKTNVDRIVNTGKQVCLQYAKNLDFLQTRGNTYPMLPQRFAFVRYEDIAHSPLRYTHSVYRFLNISLPQEVVHWVQKSTTQPSDFGRTNPYSTARNSSSTAEKWRKLLPYYITQRIDQACGDVITRLGYAPVTSLDQYNNYTLSLVKELPADIPCGLR